MSAINGDKARHNRHKKRGRIRKADNRVLQAKLTAVAKPKAA